MLPHTTPFLPLQELTDAEGRLADAEFALKADTVNRQAKVPDPRKLLQDSQRDALSSSIFTLRASVETARSRIRIASDHVESLQRELETNKSSLARYSGLTPAERMKLSEADTAAVVAGFKTGK